MRESGVRVLGDAERGFLFLAVGFVLRGGEESASCRCAGTAARLYIPSKLGPRESAVYAWQFLYS